MFVIYFVHMCLYNLLTVKITFILSVLLLFNFNFALVMSHANKAP